MSSPSKENPLTSSTSYPLTSTSYSSSSPLFPGSAYTPDTLRSLPLLSTDYTQAHAATASRPDPSYFPTNTSGQLALGSYAAETGVTSYDYASGQTYVGYPPSNAAAGYSHSTYGIGASSSSSAGLAPTSAPTYTPSPPPTVPKMASIVTGPLVSPSTDLSTGLDMFPRLPEGSASPFSDSPIGHDPLDAVTDTKSKRQGSMSSIFRGMFGGSATSSPTLANRDFPKKEDEEPYDQPIQREMPLSGGHIYCRHTWDDACKCMAILTLTEGDYCSRCWAGGCPGSRPSTLGMRTWQT